MSGSAGVTYEFLGAEQGLDLGVRSYADPLAWRRVTEGDIVVSATSDATINATSAAASLAFGGGSTFSLQLSGAGADAVNFIGGSTRAAVERSDVSSARDFVVTADGQVPRGS